MDPPVFDSNESWGIREVWRHNLDEEVRNICQIIKKYNYVAMDTEFPGVVVKPTSKCKCLYVTKLPDNFWGYKSMADYQYQMLRCNVDLLKIIQLGLTVLDEMGNTPEIGPSTWQFNFKFNLDKDMYAKESVELLLNSGILFDQHQTDGIDTFEFAELMMMSGLVLIDNIKWISFSSGFDFGYMLSILTNQNLPETEAEFFDLLKLYFPKVYDIKYMMRSCQNLKGGLQDVATELGIPRIGTQHQAGSDALTTGLTFFKMRKMFFYDCIDDSEYCGRLYGLSNSSGPLSDEGAHLPPREASTATSSSCTSFTLSEDSLNGDLRALDEEIEPREETRPNTQ